MTRATIKPAARTKRAKQPFDIGRTDATYWAEGPTLGVAGKRSLGVAVLLLAALFYTDGAYLTDTVGTGFVGTDMRLPEPPERGLFGRRYYVNDNVSGKRVRVSYAAWTQIAPGRTVFLSSRGHPLPSR